MGRVADKIAVSKLITEMRSIFLPPNKAKCTEIFISLTRYALTNEHPITVKTFAKMPLITATMILSTRKIAKIFFPLAPSPRNTPILCFFEAMLTAM